MKSKLTFLTISLFINFLFTSDIFSQPYYCSWNNRSNHTDQWSDWIRLSGSEVQGEGAVWMRVRKCPYIINTDEDIVGGTTPHGWNIEIRNDYAERVHVKLNFTASKSNGRNKSNFQILTNQTILATDGLGCYINAGNTYKNEGATGFYNSKYDIVYLEFPDRKTNSSTSSSNSHNTTNYDKTNVQQSENSKKVEKEMNDQYDAVNKNIAAQQKKEADEKAEKERKEKKEENKRKEQEKNEKQKNDANTEARMNRAKQMEKYPDLVEEQVRGNAESFASSVFTASNVFDGSNFIKSNYGLNMTITPVAFRHIPLFANDTYYYNDFVNAPTTTYYSTKSSVFTIYGYCFDAELYLIYNRIFYLKGSGAYYHAYSISSNDNETTSEYFYGGEFGIGARKLKAFAGITKGNRTLDYSYSSNVTFNQTIANTGSAQYNFQRQSLGLILNFNSNTAERYLKLSYYRDLPDYQSKYNPGVGISYRGWVDLSAEYFPKYSCSGKMIYPLKNLNDRDKSFWSFHMGKTFTLFNGRY